MKFLGGALKENILFVENNLPMAQINKRFILESKDLNPLFFCVF